MNLFKKIKSKIVPDAKYVWRHYSSGALAAVGGIIIFWKEAPASWIAAFPTIITNNIAYICFGITVVGLAGKFIKQDLPSDKP